MNVVCVRVHTVGAKKVSVSLRRTVENRSVPFPLYDQPFLGTLFVRSENGQGASGNKLTYSHTTD